MIPQLDCRGLSCPLPVVEAAKALRRLDPGAEILVIADDPGVERDFPAFCTANRHTLVEMSRDADSFRTRIRKRS